MNKFFKTAVNRFLFHKDLPYIILTRGNQLVIFQRTFIGNPNPVVCINRRTEIIFFQKKPAAFQAPFAELLQRTERMGVLHFLIQQMKLSHSEVFTLQNNRAVLLRNTPLLPDD